MMKKNYFGMIMTAIVMMFAGWSLTSCSEKDVAIVDGEVWVKPEVQLTDDGAIVKGSSPADISRMMSRIKTEISDAAKAGKAFKISVDAAINSTSSDNEISIPTPPDADIELSFTNPIQTEVPLTLKMKGAGDDATAQASTNKVEINIPSGSSDIDLDLIFPTSTVTLKGGAIDELTAITATNTLIIESGVTIEWLKMKDGRALVKDGGKINGYIRETDWNWIDVNKDGVNPAWKYGGYDVYYLDNKDEKPYCTQKLKVVEGDKKFSLLNIHNGMGKNEVEIYIVDCSVTFSAWSEQENGVIYPSKIKFVKGEGNAKLYSNSYYQNWDNEKQENVNETSIPLDAIKELSNVTVDASIVPDYQWKGGDEPEYIETEMVHSHIDLPILSNNCAFISSQVAFFNDNEMSPTSVTASNCKFETFGDNPGIMTDAVNRVIDNSLFNFIFDGCEFKDKLLLSVNFDQYVPWYDEKGNQITEAYYWLPLNDKGEIINSDFVKASPDLADVPDANKANGEWNFWGGGYEKRWWQGKPVYFKNSYTANITLTNIKSNGKAITKDNTDFISWIGRGVDSEGKYCTTTLISIDGKTYKPMLDPDTEKYILVAAE